MRPLPPKRKPHADRAERIAASILKTFAKLTEDEREDVLIAIQVAYCLYCGADKAAKPCKCAPKQEPR